MYNATSDYEVLESAMLADWMVQQLIAERNEFRRAEREARRMWRATKVTDQTSWDRQEEYLREMLRMISMRARANQAIADYIRCLRQGC